MVQRGGSLTITAKWIPDGGGAITSHGPLIIRNSILKDNFSVNYGGVIVTHSSATITDSVFEGNQSTKRRRGNF